METTASQQNSDEIEKAVGGSGNDSGTSQRVLGHLLNWMQEKEKAVFVVATANDVASIPPEMLRKGRFDEIFFVDLPTADDRKEIMNIHLRKFKRPEVDFSDGADSDASELIKATDGFSGAELEEVVVSSLFTVFDKGGELTTSDLLSSASLTVPLSRTMAVKIDELRSWAGDKARSASGPKAVDSSPKRRRGFNNRSRELKIDEGEE